MKNLARLLLGLAVALPLVANAHKVWLLPSQTVLSNSGGWVTVDGAVSNDLFHYTWYPLQLEHLAVTAPDGTSIAPQNLWKGRYRSSFELELQKPGTHRIAVYAGQLLAFYESGGEKKRWRGEPSEFAKALPADAANVQLSFDEYRVETFVSVGKPSALQPTGKGLELVPVTHPNDLAAGDTARLRFLLDGKPAADLDLVVVAGNTRYRDNQDELKLRTNASGEVSIEWPQAGLYWLEIATEDEKSPVPQARKRYITYIATLEVLP